MKNYKYRAIVKEMKKNKDSQIDLGQLIGLTSLSIRKKLSGKTEWTISEINTLCKHYGKDFYELFKTEE